MCELISRDEAKMAIENLHDELVRERAYEESQGAVDAMHVVLRLPAVDAAPVVHGRWVKVPGYATPGGDPVWRCSECGKGVHVYGIEHGTYGAEVADGQWVSCPNCGARMDGEGE